MSREKLSIDHLQQSGNRNEAIYQGGARAQKWLVDQRAWPAYIHFPLGWQVPVSDLAIRSRVGPRSVRKAASFVSCLSPSLLYSLHQHSHFIKQR